MAVQDRKSPSWWRQAVVYQIYPRSFADANGDGIGDLKGITSRVPYLSDLGVDVVWLSPFYPSALADGGYDVDDYRDVDPKIGTLADFDEMVATFHEANINVFVDIVPNHSSNLHEWFQAALAAQPGSPERDRYIFRRGIGEDHSQPPSDWKASFGGSTWEPVGDGWFYFHLFAVEQPDWNWENEEVRQDFLTTLRFWSHRGVDGFRVDVAMALAKGFGSDFPEELPNRAEMEAVPIGPDHMLYDRDMIDDIYAGWRGVFNEYDPPRVAVAELWAEPSPRKARYATDKSLGQAFYFDIMHAGFNATKVRKVVEDVLGWAAESGSASTWVLSNHDNVRHATRFGLPDVVSDDVWANFDRDRKWLLSGGVDPVEDVATGLRRARALTTFLMALPGSMYLYQGEELGLREVAEIPPEDRQDPIFFHDGDNNVGRDGCRVPLPWTADGPSFGFGTGSAHLPQPGWFADYAVSVEAAESSSTLNLYRKALKLRSQLQGAEELEWADAPESVLHIVRPGGWHAVINFTKEPQQIEVGEVVLNSDPSWVPDETTDGRGGLSTIPPETTIWFL
ncbi:MAG: glycoside hydrolase family 13 protein [Propionibacteriaceae bacterium]|jgi:alpha-glucosidase|nr:glycoside hydrolase family 13 protein [Propionibacteriaceae bacterium]